MEAKELYASLITTAITATSIIVIWLIQFFIKKLSTKNTTNQNTTLNDIVNFVLEAESKLGKGQGKAKLLYVLNKLGKKETDKKSIKKINEVHTTLKSAKEAIEKNSVNINNNKGEN